MGIGKLQISVHQWFCFVQIIHIHGTHRIFPQVDAAHPVSRGTVILCREIAKLTFRGLVYKGDILHLSRVRCVEDNLKEERVARMDVCRIPLFVQSHGILVVEVNAQFFSIRDERTVAIPITLITPKRRVHQHV